MAVHYTATVGTTDYGFDFANEQLEVENGVTSAIADDLKTAIREAEASEAGIVFDEVGFMANPTVLDPVAGTATDLSVKLLRTWKVLTLSTSGAFTLGGGNIVNNIDGVDVFAPNTLVTLVNNVSQAGTRVVTGSGVTDQNITDIVEQTSEKSKEKILGAESYP